MPRETEPEPVNIDEAQTFAEAYTGQPTVAASPTTPPPASKSDRELDFAIKINELGGLHLNRRCLILDYRPFNHGSTPYWASGFDGYRPREKAGIYTVWEVVDHMRTAEHTLEILLDAPKEPRKDGKKSDLPEHFQPPFIELMKSAPNNTMVRGHIMRIIKQMPSPELDSFEKLANWIEVNFEPPSETAATHQPKHIGPTFNLEWNLSENTSGNCDFTCTRSGSETSRFSVEDLRNVIEGEGLGADGVINAIKDSIAPDNVEMEDDPDSFDYTNYDTQDSENFQIDLDGSIRAVKEALRGFLREHAPELLEMMDNNQ